MATLHLGTLTCVKKQTTVGKDEIVIRVVGGSKIAGPITIGKTGDAPHVGADEDFEGSINISMIEIDPGNDNDDLLGTYEIQDTETKGVALFHDLNGADYHLSYTVSGS